MDPSTFEYVQLTGTRGIFDEFMWYQWFELHPHDSQNYNQPHRIPIMLGKIKFLLKETCCVDTFV
jgi:hypothetical protein